MNKMITYKLRHWKLSVIVIAFVLFAMASSSITFANSESQIPITNKTKWIMIGDSYSTRPSAASSYAWPNRLQKKLNLSNEEVCILQKGGHGFARKNLRFITHVKKLKSSKKVRYILIVGGVRNDLGADDKTVKRYMRKTFRLLKKKYPKAKIYYAAPNWDEKSIRTQKKLSRRKIMYRTECEKNGVIYIEKLQNVFVNSKNWSSKDGHHPNKDGAKKLSYRLSKYFMQECS